MSEFYSLNLFSVNTNLIKFYGLLLFCLLILCKKRGNMFHPKKEEIKIEEEPSVPSERRKRGQVSTFDISILSVLSVKC